MPSSNTKTDIEKIRRRDLLEAAYLTFLEQGLSGMTMARIGERAGMSHGIVNYYFKNKDELLSAVVRKANILIMKEVARRLGSAVTPRQRISAVIAGNFPRALFTREVARAWASYYAALGQKPEFDRLQTVVDRRLASNLHDALRQLTSKSKAREIATGVAILIDGIWLRHAKSSDNLDSNTAVSFIENYVDQALRTGGNGRGRRVHRLASSDVGSSG
jgi:TetR/AcrR family transcriptional regulator, transcriptional repressor of bet genes